ncbi:MAG: type II toxin-antitoxin system HicA family toxin [Verrucomicrobia bacterium]|nr:type II toxin-antitoxin system HicA family toxin [Verrucomicrobiota bacterium]
MPRPISRRELIRRMRLFGFTGPFPGKRQELMRRGPHSVPIPNPHGNDIDWTLTKRILKQAGIEPEDWDRAS